MKERIKEARKNLTLGKVALTHLAIGIDTQFTRHVLAVEKVVKQHLLRKCFTCNAFQVISDLLNRDNLNSYCSAMQ